VAFGKGDDDAHRSNSVPDRVAVAFRDAVAAPAVQGVLETCLYAGDLDAAERFYVDVIGLTAFAREPGRHVFLRCGDAVFLVFNAERTRVTAAAVGGVPIPPHGAVGPGHVAFRVCESGLERWRARLTGAGVSVEAEVEWPGGGRSLYVRDPAGNSVELATARVWGLAEREGD
jgi:catechol 2,3-dioxygenase-like lactoylglutathione lyase family enzyme